MLKGEEWGKKEGTRHSMHGTNSLCWMWLFYQKCTSKINFKKCSFINAYQWVFKSFTETFQTLLRMASIDVPVPQDEEIYYVYQSCTIINCIIKIIYSNKNKRTLILFLHFCDLFPSVLGSSLHSMVVEVNTLYYFNILKFISLFSTISTLFQWYSFTSLGELVLCSNIICECSFPSVSPILWLIDDVCQAEMINFHVSQFRIFMSFVY